MGKKDSENNTFKGKKELYREGFDVGRGMCEADKNFSDNGTEFGDGMFIVEENLNAGGNEVGNGIKGKSSSYSHVYNLNCNKKNVPLKK
ncbi:hypothetical protein VQL36_06325 [Chengkuizengella sp. SCS-71B]|uniref:hypothetical protein n=1 Tax=Chengkuizengella sp. SCS-71B TaxID=3115290 RepID=UPI0032C2426D